MDDDKCSGTCQLVYPMHDVNRNGDVRMRQNEIFVCPIGDGPCQVPKLAHWTGDADRN